MFSKKINVIQTSKSNGYNLIDNAREIGGYIETLKQPDKATFYLPRQKRHIMLINIEISRGCKCNSLFFTTDVLLILFIEIV